MALSNIVLLSQIAGYVIAFILSLCIVVPMSLHQDEFKLALHHCIKTKQKPIVVGVIVYYFQQENGKKQTDN